MDLFEEQLVNTFSLISWYLHETSSRRQSFLQKVQLEKKRSVAKKAYECCIPHPFLEIYQCILATKGSEKSCSEETLSVLFNSEFPKFS